MLLVGSLALFLKCSSWILKYFQFVPGIHPRSLSTETMTRYTTYVSPLDSQSIDQSILNVFGLIQVEHLIQNMDPTWRNDDNNHNPHCIMIPGLAPKITICTTLSIYLSIVCAKKNHASFCQFLRYQRLSVVGTIAVFVCLSWFGGCYLVQKLVVLQRIQL